MATLSRPAIRALLIDLSGTIHIGSTPTPNAIEGLQKLRKYNVPFRFCSNTSKESTAELRARLIGMGFEIESSMGGREEVWTSIGAVNRRLQGKGLKRPYFLLSDTARDECLSSLEHCTNTPYDSIVVGLAPLLFTYEHLNFAFRILISSQSSSSSSSPSRPKPIPLIATHKAKYIRSSDSALSLGPGPFIAALENASGVQAEVVGKPSREFFETVIGNFNTDEIGSDGKIVVIGDDVEADLGEGAVELGLWRVLVKTGKYRPGDEHRPGIRRPDEVYDSFAAFVDSLVGAAAHSRL